MKTVVKYIAIGGIAIGAIGLSERALATQNTPSAACIDHMKAYGYSTWRHGAIEIPDAATEKFGEGYKACMAGNDADGISLLQEATQLLGVEPAWQVRE